MMFVLWWRGGRFLHRAAAKTNVMLLPQKLVVTAPLFFSLTRETLLSWIFFLDENTNCAFSKWSKWIPTSLQVQPALAVAHCTVPVYIEKEADCKRIPSYYLLRLHWLQSDRESQTKWDECGDWSSHVPGLSGKALISPLVCLWHCSGMRFYTLQYIAWLTQY